MNDVRIDLLPPEIATWLVALMTVVAIAISFGVRTLTERFRARLPRLAVILPRAFAAVAAAWFLLQLIGRVATYACPWPLWVAALMLGLGVECVLACFRRERQALSPRLGKLIPLLRTTAVAVTALILMQPVLVRSTDKRITRRVAVLVDGSASMRFTDRQWTPLERLQWAAHVGALGAEQQAALTNAATDAGALWDSLPETARAEVNVFCETTRVALACAMLTQPVAAGVPFLETLGNRYDLSLFTVGRGLSWATEADLHAGLAPTGTLSFAERHFQGATDLTAALEGVLKEIPSEHLAGVLLISDGLHNADTSVLPVTRRFGAQGAPICGVMVGGTRLPFDVALADVTAPE